MCDLPEKCESENGDSETNDRHRASNEGQSCQYIIMGIGNL